jgi:hypothetical protein
MADRTSAEPSETSPLLGKGSIPSTITYLESGGSPVGPLPSSNAAEAERTSDHGSDVPTDANLGADEENGLARQATADSGRDVQFKGLPDVRKQLKFILPAVAIGIFLSAADQTLVASAAGSIGSSLNDLKSTSWIAT